jgi:hypothetical protein
MYFCSIRYLRVSYQSGRVPSVSRIQHCHPSHLPHSFGKQIHMSCCPYHMLFASPCRNTGLLAHPIKTRDICVILLHHVAQLSHCTLLLFSHQCLDLINNLFPSGFSIKILNASLTSPCILHVLLTFLICLFIYSWFIS